MASIAEAADRASAEAAERLFVEWVAYNEAAAAEGGERDEAA